MNALDRRAREIWELTDEQLAECARLAERANLNEICGRCGTVFSAPGGESLCPTCSEDRRAEGDVPAQAVRPTIGVDPEPADAGLAAHQGGRGDAR